MSTRGPLVFVDLEVAGAEVTRPIIEIAAIAIASDFEELETFAAKLTFDERLADARSLTRKRYSAETWAAEARSATAVAYAFAAFLRRYAVLDTNADGSRTHRVAQLVTHNASFDGPFLKAWFERVDLYFPGDFRILCTLQRANWLFHEYPSLRRPRDLKLGTLCKYFGIDLPLDQAHTALADVRATVELFRRIMLLDTAESANQSIQRSLTGCRDTRVACVASERPKACLSRRRPRPKACRSRRRRFQGRHV
jgi:hypothetical protein